MRVLIQIVLLTFPAACPLSLAAEESGKELLRVGLSAPADGDINLKDAARTLKGWTENRKKLETFITGMHSIPAGTQMLTMFQSSERGLHPMSTLLSAMLFNNIYSFLREETQLVGVDR